MKDNFIVKTPNREVKIEVYSGFINKEDISVDKNCFDKLCKKCRNYGKKYSCPPYSPDFNIICKRGGLFVVMFKCNLEQIKNTTEYNKIRIANSMMKSRIDKLLRKIEEKNKNKFKFLSTGSCRLCKKCNLQKNLPCKHPLAMRFSMESTGINVEDLTKKLFNTSLLWYDSKNHKAPEYTCVVGAIMCDEEDIYELKKYNLT